jgi:hypothetical protein
MEKKVFYSYDSTEISKRNYQVIDWLVKKFDLPPYNHSFRDGFALIRIWVGQLTISFDFRCEEQKALFDAIPNEYKGTKQVGTGKLVNEKTLYFDLNKEFDIPYPEVIKINIVKDWWDGPKHDSDSIHFFEFELTLADGSIYHNKEQKPHLSKGFYDYVLPSKIQQKFFYEQVEKISNEIKQLKMEQNFIDEEQTYELTVEMTGEKLLSLDVLKVGPRRFVSTEKSKQLMTDFVAKLINDGKLSIVPGHEEFFKELKITFPEPDEAVRKIAKSEFDKHAGHQKDNAIAWHWWKRAFDAAALIFKPKVNNDDQK